MDEVIGEILFNKTAHRFFPFASDEPTFHPHHSIELYDGAPSEFSLGVNLIKQSTLEQYPVKNQLQVEMMQVWDGFMNSRARLPIEFLGGTMRNTHEVLSFLEGAVQAMRHLYSVEVKARAQVIEELEDNKEGDGEEGEEEEEGEEWE
jgi:hypothetical protein